MKKIISLTLAFSFLIMSVTGMMLYIVPKGKIAYWASWKMFGLSKTQYGDIHITSMFLFLVVTIWHIYYNWKPLMSYLKDKSKKITFLKKEFLIALGINTFFVLGTLVGLQPFQSLLDMNEGIKSYWEKEYGSPPYSHAEESSLQVFSKKIGVDIESARKLLQEKNILVDKNSQTLLNIAQKNTIAPKVIYEAIKPKKGTSQTEISSLGRRTLDELSQMNVIDLEKSLLFLKEKGFEAKPISRMREIANALETTPYELFDTLKVLQ